MVPVLTVLQKQDQATVKSYVPACKQALLIGKQALVIGKQALLIGKHAGISVHFNRK